MKTFLFALSVALVLPVSGRTLKLRTTAQVVSQSTPKPVAVACRSAAEVKAALGAEHAAVSKLLLLDKVDFKKKMVVVIRAGRVNAFGVSLSLLSVARAKDGKTATVVWQYKPYFGGAAPPNQPGNPTLTVVLDRFDIPIKFQRKNWRYPKGLPLAADEAAQRNILQRGGYANSQLQFVKNKNGRVAFMGGSITQMNGYRPMVAGWLQKRFPETQFEFVNAGISSTCSTTGAFRLRSEVLAKGKVDLFFIEFAVNDDQDAGHAARECVRGLEGIIRHARKEQPNMDIVVTHFVNPGMLSQLRAGKMPLSMAAHEKVLNAYNVSTIFLAREVADRIDAGKLTWAVFGGTHPKPAGNRIAGDMIAGLLDKAWSRPPIKKAAPHALPWKPLDFGSYQRGQFLSPAASANAHWIWHVPTWKSIPGSFRSNPFGGKKLLTATEAGHETAVKFNGRALGAYVLAGPDAGVLEVSLDGGEWKRVDLYHRHSRGLHYPRTVMFATDLKAGTHNAKIRLSPKSNPRSKGTAARVLQFVVN